MKFQFACAREMHTYPGVIRATWTRRTSGSVTRPDDEGPAGSPRRGPRGSDEASGSPAPGGLSPSQMVLEELGGSRHGCACEMRAQQRFVHVTCRRQRRGHTDQAFSLRAPGCRLGKNRPAPHPGRQAVGVQGTCSRRCRFECPEFLDILGATFPRTKVDCVLFGK